MSVTLDESLNTFYDKVSSSLDSISSTVTSLSSKIGEMKTLGTSTASSISSSYSGDGLSTAINNFASIDAACDGITASLDAGPVAAVSMAQALVDKIKDLLDKMEVIKAKEDELSKLGGERSYSNDDGKDHSADRAHNQRVKNLKSEITSLESEFNTNQEAAKGDLAALKALNPELDISVKEQVVASEGDIMAELSSLEPGSYKTFTFTGSNGRTVKYSIYVPATASTTTGLPVHVYMGGSGEVGKMNAGGLAKLLSEGQQSTGIVIVLEADHSNAYTEDKYLDASKELIDNVVTTYKADTNRISVSGHSLGGIGALHMAERFPNYFSVVAPVSGYNNQRGKQSGHSSAAAYEKLKGEHIVAVTGKSDSKSLSSMNVLNTKLKDGGNMQFITVSGGHRIQFKMYGEQVEVNGKTYANWLEFCLAQTKDGSSTTA
jgi:predicted peptidase